MFALVSPAKKLDFDPWDESLPVTRPDFLDRAAALIDRLRGLSPGQVQGLMKLSDDLTELNVARYRAWAVDHGPDAAKPAVLAFAGDTYVGLKAGDLDRDALAWAQDHLGILSGLYGLLRPLDLIRPYRLEMGSRLANDHGRDLYAFWGGDLARTVAERLADHRHKVLVNLASAEYIKAVRRRDLGVPMVTCVFKEVRDGVDRVIALKAKRARGMMARFLIDHRLEDPADLRAFAEDGYRWRADVSTEAEWVFVREAGQP